MMRANAERNAVFFSALGLVVGCQEPEPEPRPAIDAIAYIEGVCDDLFDKAVECGTHQPSERNPWLEGCVSDGVARHETERCFMLLAEFGRCRTERVPCEVYTEVIETMPGTVCYEFRVDVDECYEECYPNAGADDFGDPVCESYPQ